MPLIPSCGIGENSWDLRIWDSEIANTSSVINERKPVTVWTGFVQFVESVAVAEILAVEGSIVSFFRKLAPNDNTTSGIAPELMDNYIKSCGLSTAIIF